MVMDMLNMFQTPGLFNSSSDRLFGGGYTFIVPHQLMAELISLAEQNFL